MTIDSPIVVLLAVDVAVPAETGDLAVESLTAVRALKTGGVPPPVHGLQVEPVGYPKAASGANDSWNVLGLRWRCGWWLQFRYSVQMFRGLLFLGVGLRVEVGMVVVMVMVVVVRRLGWHAQVAGVLEVARVVVIVVCPVLVATWEEHFQKRLVIIF